MKIQFGDTAKNQFEKLLDNRILWNIGFFFGGIKDFFIYGIPGLLKNLWYFRKVLWEHRWYDYHYTLRALQTSLIIMEKKLHNGNEIEISRDKKIEKIQRSIAILENILEYKHIDMAESELGDLFSYPWEFEDIPDKPGFSRLLEKETPEEKEHNHEVYERSREIEENEWNELWVIFKGQSKEDFENFRNDTKDSSDKEKEDNYYKYFDGSGMRGWWD
jgi:hypothetical protein